ncbi:MAG: type IV pilus twitching motility protein PilT [Planctomycetes bacterium]|nr:type IV pilus twitching motility protein PilT [Planctomycetota bacterium]
MDIQKVLRELVARRGSDLHLKVGRPPMMRITGELLPSEFPIVTTADMNQVLKELSDEATVAKFRTELETDFGYEIEGVARFRVNAFHRMGEPGSVMRVIPLEVPTIEKLGLPPVLKDLVMKKQGLILVTGPTGSGKSTSLAAMINHLNETRAAHIVTIEDPIEFVYTDKRSTITQRQLGLDTKSLKEALKRALRQDPNIILMGEMRDIETIETAFHAAETGHLVMSTLHTNDAKQSVNRIIDMFPSDQHSQVRAMLAQCLEGVLSQRLVKRADGNGRVVAMEIMVGAPQIKELIAEGKTHDIEKAIMKGSQYYRMQTFNQALAKLAMDKVVTEEDAMAASANPADLQLLLKGIVQGGGAGNILRESSTNPTGGTKAAPAPVAAAAAPGGQPESKPKISKGFNF